MSNPRYQAYYKPNQVICGTGAISVVTGWTLKESVAKKLEPHEYAAIGQLYSPTRGISFLIRNLLANPHVRNLVIIDATPQDKNAGACQCLFDFFCDGVELGTTETGKVAWIINSNVTGYIDAEIPAWDLSVFGTEIKVHKHSSVEAAIAYIKELAKLPTRPPWGASKYFPMPDTPSDQTQLPGTQYGHRIEGKTIAQTWVKILHRIRTTGVARATAYDGQWQELINLMAIVTDEPPEIEFPEPNYLPCDRAFLGEYVAQMCEDAQPQEGVKYTYGQRLRSWFGKDQIEQAIAHLAEYPDSARAVMSLWDAQDYEQGSSPPCLNHIWLRLSGNTLTLTATFRSNDMFSAWPANAMGLRVLQKRICDAIAERRGQVLRMGSLITISQSAHIYDDCWENADQTIRTHYPQICRQRDFADPAGSFLVSLLNQEIVVEQMTPGSGDVVACYGGKTAKQIYQQIAQASPGLEVEHALYLGTELQKAEFALQHPQLGYEQDKNLLKASL